MAGEVQYILGGVALSYALFEWPKYRGTIARRIELVCPAKMYPELEQLAKSLKGKATFFEVSGPDKSGNNPGTLTVVIEGVYIDRIVLLNEHVCRVTLYDRRILVSRRVAALDINQSFGDGVLEGTAHGSLFSAMHAWLAQEPEINANTDFGSVLRVLLGQLYAGKEYFSGLSAPMAMGAFADKNNFDIVCWNNGKMAVATRKDIDGATELPQAQAYDWHVEPGWLSKDAIVLGRPKDILKYYHERHCLRLVGTDPTATVTSRGADELWVELEQVYTDNGQIKTLAELLTSNGFAANELTDAMIANSFWTENFENAPIATAFGTVTFDAVHKAVRDGWRRLWRITFPKAIGHIGGWTDFVFGKINADGSAQTATVDCDWVEFLTTPSSDGRWEDSPTTVNHTRPAPFMATWEGDSANGVIRLSQRPLPDGNVAIPGSLVRELKIRRQLNNAIADAKNQTYNFNNYDVIEAEPWSMARFSHSFEIAIFLCATKRLPNNRGRWWVEKVPAFQDGDIDEVELPVSQDLYAVRDYVDVTDPAHMPGADGYGPILNGNQIKDDAKAHGRAWELTHGAALDGFGIAESIGLFIDKEVSGPIQQITLVGTLEGPNQVPVVRTRIDVGNLADPEQRKRYGIRRLATREFSEAGVQ